MGDAGRDSTELDSGYLESSGTSRAHRALCAQSRGHAPDLEPHNGHLHPAHMVFQKQFLSNLPMQPPASVHP